MNLVLSSPGLLNPGPDGRARALAPLQSYYSRAGPGHFCTTDHLQYRAAAMVTTVLTTLAFPQPLIDPGLKINITMNRLFAFNLF